MVNSVYFKKRQRGERKVHDVVINVFRLVKLSPPQRYGYYPALYQQRLWAPVDMTCTMVKCRPPAQVWG